jgi:hypothetical protein
MGFFDEPLRAEIADARDGILHLLRNRPSQGTLVELLDLAERYLRLNPEDAEVRAALNRLKVPARSA